MNVKEEKLCRLCLNVAENDFEIIDEITRTMFEVLLLKVNFDISKDPVICKDCAQVMEKCYHFKSACNDTELIFSLALDEKGDMFELKDVCKDENDSETIDDNFPCRFCANHLSGTNFVLLDTLMADVIFAEMLQKLMPEMDFHRTKNPVICTSCYQNLECYFKFVKNSLEVEEKIMKYNQNEGISSSAQVKLSEIQFSFNNILKTDYTEMYAIKKEGDASKLDYTQKGVIKQEENTLEDIDEAHSETYDGELIKAEEALDIKDEETSSEMPGYKLNRPCELKTNIGKAWKALTRNSSITPTSIGKYKNEVNQIESQIFKCSICTYQAKRKAHLKNHMLIHKDITEVEMYKCSICTYETKHKNSLKRHILLHKDITEVKMYKCSMCTYQAKQNSSLNRHIMLIHKDVGEGEIYKCPACTYETKHKSSLNRHMLIHKDITDVEMYKCSMCTYETIHKSSLKSHMLIHKDITEVEMYKCSKCTYQAKQKRSLKRHTMLIHKDIGEVETRKNSACTYETKCKRDLMKHKNITRQVKMYKCSMCTYVTKDKSHLNRHMFVHKDIRELEINKCTYKCTMCTYETKDKSHLNRHMLIHKDVRELEMYKCTTCSFQTKRKASLTRHMLIHKDVREVEMHKCSMCNYETKRKGCLKIHMFIHKKH